MIIDRWTQIIDLLKKNQNMSIEDLAKRLDVSHSTIRRDIAELKKRDFIAKAEDGYTVQSVEENVMNPVKMYASTIYRNSANIHKKEIIARKAVSLIGDARTIFIGAGTASFMAKFIDNKNIVVFSNSVYCIAELASKGISVYVCGGYINSGSEAIYSQDYTFFEDKYFDKCFLGASGISEKAGLTTVSALDYHLKKAIISHSEETYILCDSSKFNQRQYLSFSKLKDITLISNADPKIKTSGFKCIIAD